MRITNEKLTELINYKPELTRQPDFSVFWENNLKQIFENENYPKFLRLDLKEYSYPLRNIKVYKATMPAIDGTLIHGWYLYPAQANEENKVPALVRFHGYSSNKGKLCELLLWALQGYAVLAFDVRGQCGDTPDNRVYTTGSFAGWLTRGLSSPQEYYYRQVYLDCVQQIEALARRPEVSADKIGLFGNSQGAALAIISAGLLTKFSPLFPQLTAKVAIVNAAIPFLSDIEKAYREHSDGPWTELDWYFRMFDPFHKQEDKVFEILSYFDAMNFAPWVSCPVLMAVALKDTTCPPATAYALYNHLAGPKRIIPYVDYAHESIDNHTDEQIVFFAQKLLDKIN
ncbi:MAG: acetylxylan esterase [Peptococcaceae bacterium]|jgi:cephalosporin-C deacetylase|nr:acetylxylan esterase [Peptococcaceae bacterium]